MILGFVQFLRHNEVPEFLRDVAAPVIVPREQIGSKIWLNCRRNAGRSENTSSRLISYGWFSELTCNCHGQSPGHWKKITPSASSGQGNKPLLFPLLFDAHFPDFCVVEKRCTVEHWTDVSHGSFFFFFFFFVVKNSESADFIRPAICRCDASCTICCT